MPPVNKYSAKQRSTKGDESPSQLAGHSSGLAGIQQEREEQRAKNSERHTLLFSDFIALQARPRDHF